MTDDILTSLGHLALGSRLKRAGTLLQSATQTWLRQAGCDVPPGHLPLLAALDMLGPATLGRLVDALGVAQPGVSRMAASLEAGGWIASNSEANDKRVRVLALTDQGQRFVDVAKTDLWPVIQDAAAQLCADLSGPLTSQLADLEKKISLGEYQDALEAGSREIRPGHGEP